jgi:DNA-binding NtrC family response regulator
VLFRSWQRSERRVHVLVSDMIMPGGMSGLDLAQHLQREQPDLGIILMSGYACDLGEGDSLRQSGAYYLPKPVDVQALARAVRDVLDRTGAPRPADGKTPSSPRFT